MPTVQTPYRPRLLYVVTHPTTARHLLAGQLAWMREHGFDVAVACAPGPDLEAVAERESVKVFAVPMTREISPVTDAKSALALIMLMRRWRPDVVNAGTPKAGLMGMLAARLTAVPVRVYTLRGLRLETTIGAKRLLLEMTERVASWCAHLVLAVSGSLAEQYVALRLAPAAKVRVTGAGASNGVDVGRFADRPVGENTKLRKQLGIPEDAPVIGFVGRLTRDKGIVELMAAFAAVRQRVPQARLLLVGAFESGDPVPPATGDAIEQDPAVVLAGFVPDAAPYYALMEVLAFPSYREGFPNAPLEAAASGIPVAGFRATGTVDAVVDGETGTLVEIGDTAGLAAALERYLSDAELARAHGQAGKQRASRKFSNEVVWEALAGEYNRLLGKAGYNVRHPLSRHVRDNG